MKRILTKATGMYKSSRSPTTPLGSASITSLKLNKQPLPKQPVPDLSKTASRYLRSVLPFLNDEEYKNTARLVEEFVKDGGVGWKLQEKLLERFKNTDNWMSKWWLKTAYLGYRDPVIVNSSPGTVGPPLDFKSPEDVYLFAARLIGGVCDYNESIKRGDMKQEMARDSPLDMQPYAMILGTHRRPNRQCDKLIHTDEAKHVVLLCNNHFYKLCVHDGTSVSSEKDLVAAIRDVVERSCAPAEPVGILTGNDRDTWAENYQTLLGLGKNREILKDIETSLFVLCLDREVPKEAFEGKNVASVRALQSLTGFDSCTNAGNRWHDKTVQFIVSSDGFMGMEYEHSPCEGIPVAVLHDYVLKFIASKETNPRRDNKKDFPRAELLKFEVNEVLRCAIEKATKVVDQISRDADMECFRFQEFGAEDIKKAKLSPDSFIQIAMQVTFYRLHGEPPAHYESAALRRFKNARTECIRSTSCESVEFAKTMCTDEGVASKEKKKSMVRAIEAHKKLAGEAAMGEGVDRHLYGLKMLLQEEGMDLPELYKDKAYTKSTRFNLTSSQVPYKTASFMCYGPAVPEGYGCCYNPRPKDIFFACSSRRSSKFSRTKDFAETLRRTLLDMKNLADV